MTTIESATGAVYQYGPRTLSGTAAQLGGIVEAQPTEAYRDCYRACRAAGGSVSACMESCAGLMPGEIGSTSILQNFIEGFQLPTAPEVGAVFAPVQRTLWLAIAAAVLVYVATRR